MKIIKEIKKDVKKVVKVAKAVGSGVVDYRKKNAAVHKEALNTVGAEQQRRIANVGSSQSATPYGTNAFYGKAEEEARRLKKERNISLKSSVRAQLGLK